MSASRLFARKASETGGNGSRRVLGTASEGRGARAPRSPRSGIYLRLLRDARPYARRIAALTLLSLLATPLALLLPIPLKIAVDSVIGSQPPPAILDSLLPTAATQSDTGLLITVGVMFVAIALLDPTRGAGESDPRDPRRRAAADPLSDDPVPPCSAPLALLSRPASGGRFDLSHPVGCLEHPRPRGGAVPTARRALDVRGDPLRHRTDQLGACARSARGRARADCDRQGLCEAAARGLAHG